ncbi:MAG: tRNA (N6-isopentenyl adenosine(37)-C2)-methylthiotransferase MiaB [Oscillospiraceae bacterium]|nr:tRNA (N6-isopentenyl adenosine(37)-C2)-methylthiotransferase MiaB [Oscillospiraceae bacterium]
MREKRLIAEEELLRQRDYMERVRAMHDEPKYAFVDTYGCQQNEADSEILRGLLLEMGYAPTKDETLADIILVNSCAVREHAEMRILGNVGALKPGKRLKPGQIIGICGCMVQQEHMAEKIRKSFHHVNLVFGTHAVHRLPELLYQVLTSGKRVFAIEDKEHEIVEGLPVLRASKTKAWVSIMYGCNNFCSYCIVPYVRGRERSRDPDVIVSEITQLISEGARDITLLGQNVNSYGLDRDDGVNFSELLRRLNAIPGKFRLRFMTSHPKDASKELFETMASCEKVCKHIHLPFQSGSNRILKEMNRKYTREHYQGLVDYARSLMPSLALTSDVIVGFPSETEKDFEDTLDLVETIGFDALFTFLYSRRKGTPAAELPDCATKEERQVRFERLLALQNEHSKERNQRHLGTRVEVLIEADTPEKMNLLARCDDNRPVRFAGDPSLVGRFAIVEITECAKWSMEGTVISILPE